MNHEKFITSIHLRPALWDTRTYEYRNKRLKDLLWIEVGESVNITGNVAAAESMLQFKSYNI